MVNSLVVLALYVSVGVFPNINGQWKLPFKGEPTVKLLVSSKKEKVIGILKVYVKYSVDPIYIPLEGKIVVIKEKKYTLVMDSPVHIQSNGCSIRTTLVSKGRFSKHTYRSTLTGVITVMLCEKKEPVIKMDVVKGKWIRTGLLKKKKFGI
jgi:hypothetical protein